MARIGVIWAIDRPVSLEQQIMSRRLNLVRKENEIGSRRLNLVPEKNQIVSLRLRLVCDVNEFISRSHQIAFACDQIAFARQQIAPGGQFIIQTQLGLVPAET